MLGVLPLPGGERVGVRGSEAHRETITPHPTPLPMGEGAERARGTHIRIGRRAFISLLAGAAVWPRAARAQQMLRVGFVGIQPRESSLYKNFLRRMAELGHHEGRNFAFEYIQTPDVDSYEKDYRALAARKIDVFLAVGNERALRAALAVAGGKPIAFLTIYFDPQPKTNSPTLPPPPSTVPAPLPHPDTL